MRTYLGVLLAVLLIASSGVGSVAMSSSDDSVSNSMMECDFPVTRTDATGTKVTVEQIPNRVVVLAPSTAQTMWEIGAKDIVVGMPVNKYTAYLEGYQKRTNVVNARGIPVIEKVIEANPDLVLAANIITDNTVQTLREENITVYKFRMASSIQDIMNKTMLTGRLTGRCNGAHSTVEWMKQKLSVVREAVKGENRPSIFYHLGAGWTAGEGSFIHRVIQIAGGHNIAAEANLSGAYGQVSNEFILKQNPAWLLATYYGKQPANLKKIVAANDAIKQTIAWKRNNIIAVKANYLNQPAPRVVWPIINITKELHPIAYREAKQSPTPTQTATPTTTLTSTQTQTQTQIQAQTTQPTTTTSPSNGQPGFTPIIALIAIVGTLLGWCRIRSS